MEEDEYWQAVSLELMSLLFLLEKIHGQQRCLFYSFDGQQLVDGAHQ